MKILTLFCLMCITGSLGYCQGTINFNNRVPAAGIDAPVYYPPGSLFGGPTGTRVDGTVHPTAQAALYAGPDGASAGQLTLVGPAVGFLSGTSAGYVNVGANGARAIPGVAAGSFVTVQVRAWEANNGTTAASYEAAAAVAGSSLGVSDLLRIQIPISGSANLVGLQPIALGVPEPGSIILVSLGILCAASFKLGRKNFKQELTEETRI